MDHLLNGLWEIYQLENWHETRLTKEEADKYHKEMLEAGRIITVSDRDSVIGYVEFLLNNGCCFVNNLFIRQEYRNREVIWMLRRRLYEVCGNAKIYLGSRLKNNKRFSEVQLRRNP